MPLLATPLFFFLLFLLPVFWCLFLVTVPLCFEDEFEGPGTAGTAMSVTVGLGTSLTSTGPGSSVTTAAGPVTIGSSSTGPGTDPGTSGTLSKALVIEPGTRTGLGIGSGTFGSSLTGLVTGPGTFETSSSAPGLDWNRDICDLVDRNRTRDIWYFV